MNVQQILQSLQPIFRDVLDNPSLRVGCEDSAAGVPGWDSLAHINLVAAIEREFNVRFKLGELQDLTNVGDMVALIAGKIDAPPARMRP